MSDLTDWNAAALAQIRAIQETAARRATERTRPMSDDDKAEDRAAERRGDYLSDRERDREADAAADRYERWMEGA